ncbi:vomeronasal type-1 receptor 4-like [Orycteropus afer afer]|uniref:Vomeronasal type-1 receptor 4-like n=1 Tax=Orycteropus afer afer TaxID=1230840 RepID=A0AC54ZFW2_ORYAF|nr:vomeronasal type-1 receptor 4-like [Orycteropus afer afer]
MWAMSHLPRQDSLAKDKYQSLGSESMSSREFAVGMLFLSQTTVGILGNFSLLHQYVFLHFTGGRLRSTDLIVRHLTVANSLVILSKGIDKTLTAFGWKDFLSDFRCKFLLFVQKVSRGVSMGSTCLLSMFQAITINPSNSRWAELKLKAPKYVGPSTVLCWVLHMLVNIIVPVYVTGNWGNKTLTKKKDFGYCSSVLQDITTRSLHVVLFSFPDVLCLGLMMWSSGCMVCILYRHKQRVQHIHRNNISARSSPESRATQSILVLVSTFVGFYTLSSILNGFVTFLHSPTWWLVDITALTAASFPTVSPYVLLSHDSRVSRLCRVCAGDKKQFSHQIKNI